MIRAGCDPITLETGYSLHFRHFSHSGAIALVTGSLMGHLFEYQYFVNTGKLNQSEWNWHRSSPLKATLRILVSCLATGAPTGLLMFLGKQIREGISHKEPLQQAYVDVTVRYIIPMFTAGFITFAFLRLLSNKLGLDNESSVGQAFQTRAKYL